MTGERVEFFYDLSSPWTYLALTNLSGVLERDRGDGQTATCIGRWGVQRSEPVGLCRARGDRQPQAET